MAKSILELIRGSPQGRFLGLLKSRKSTYDYSGRMVSDGNLRAILEAGRWSPSFRNLQPWEFVVIKNKDKITSLLQSAHYGFYDYYKHGSHPPVVVGLVLKKKYWSGEYGFPSKDKAGIFEAYMSIAMPAMNMMLQAEELGVSSTLLNMQESLSYKLVKLEHGDCMPIMVCLGYEKDGSEQKPRERKPLEEIVRSEDSTGIG